MNNKSAFEIIEEISSSLENDYLVKARSEGKKTIGFVCSFVPQEILTAAGAVPFRIRATGSTSTDKSEVYMAPTHCSFVRHTLNQALSGAYSFLDGVIFSITCDHSRRMYDNWKYADASPKFRYIMTVPHVTKQIDINGFVRDLKKMADVAAELTGQIVTIEKLRESIKLYDKQRDVILKINETRKSQSPSVTGLEMLKLYQSLMSIPVEDGIVLAEKFLEELQTRPSVVDSDALRFILSSSHYEDHKHLAAIESKKTIIVQDSGCIGSGHFSGMVPDMEDPYQALAERILTRYSCPHCIDRVHHRRAVVDSLIKEWNCDAVVVDSLQFCVYWLTEGFIQKEVGSESGFPVLNLTHELYGGGIGQLKTRIEAFSEQIRNNKKLKKS